MPTTLKKIFLAAALPMSLMPGLAFGEPVTMENYVVAETDWNFAAHQAQTPVNTWVHDGPATEESQTIIRSNVDVVYSRAIVDVSEGATLSVPERAKLPRFLSSFVFENGST